jgi:hypothetical protein
MQCSSSRLLMIYVFGTRTICKVLDSEAGATHVCILYRPYHREGEGERQCADQPFVESESRVHDDSITATESTRAQNLRLAGLRPHSAQA